MAAIVDAFEREGSYKFAAFFEEDKTKNMAIDERLEELFGKDKVKEEENGEFETEERVEVMEEDELKEWA